MGIIEGKLFPMTFAAFIKFPSDPVIFQLGLDIFKEGWVIKEICASEDFLLHPKPFTV